MVPSAPKFVSYVRVSTQRQGQSGLGLEAQEHAVAQHITGSGGRLVEAFREVESGKNRERPQLLAAIRKAKLTRATLVIAKLDRLARDYHFLRSLQDAGVEFVACDMPHANRITVHILAAVAEDEAKRTSERTKVALAAAKARGVKLGGDRCGIAQFATKAAAASAAVRSARADGWSAHILEVVESVQNAGAKSLRAVAAALNKEGFTTARDGQWTATQVKRVLDRTAA